ncbi:MULTISPECIES: hypothetical protein [Pseudomonas syringae group]|uniref:hypothetical protein n=1 Tax=Pseudomonas syringae group TaxID=136849 RepID=UPI001FB56349|nr:MULTISPECIES: hypothetical protein [Pseudomonas syringae group]UNO25988.1 hypothetical protein MDO45_00260 [Pseudomonas amygdali pv. aesculi]
MSSDTAVMVSSLRLKRRGVAYTELATLAGASRAGTALAMGNTCVFVVLFATPIAASSLMTHFSWGVVWLAAAFCALLTVPLFPRVEKSYALAPRST